MYARGRISIVVLPNLDRRNNEYPREEGQQHAAWHQTEQVPAEKGAGERSCRHHQDKALVAAQHGEAAVTAVTGEAGDHRRQTDSQREAARQFDVDAE